MINLKKRGVYVLFKITSGKQINNKELFLLIKNFLGHCKYYLSLHNASDP